MTPRPQPRQTWRISVRWDQGGVSESRDFRFCGTRAEAQERCDELRRIESQPFWRHADSVEAAIAPLEGDSS